jgi:uncharacterized membrane protein YidH (DUF202 family)
LAPSSAFDETLRDKLRGASEERRRQEEAGELDEEEEMAAVPEEDRLVERSRRAPKGKRISVPVRIEPKVYFAAERTFLKWLNTAIFIGTIATTLLNFTSPKDERGLISAFFFTFVALFAIAYSCGVFVYRAYRLRHHRASGLYYDKWGPTVLCFALLAAMGTDLGLRLSQVTHGDADTPQGNSTAF